MFLKLFLFVTLISGCLMAKPIVLVSIAPEKFFVEKIAGDSVDVVVLVPPGASPHSFEPTAKQLILASKASLWFRLGEPFEKRAIEVLTSHHKEIQIIDIRKDVPLLAGSGCVHCCSEGIDTHIWLSPRRAKIQAKTMKEALVTLMPQNESIYQTNYFNLIAELEEIDAELEGRFARCNEKTIMVSHPAFGYLCDDYQLTQLSIEIEGKDPSPRQLTELLRKARNLHIKAIFAQEQYQTKGAILLAKELGAEIYMVDPYSSDYLNNLKTIGELFTQ